MSDNESCRIWGPHFPATVRTNHNPSFAIVDSIRSGGRYKLLGDARNYIGELDDGAKARLTTWLVDQHMRGVELPEVSGATIQFAKQKPPFPVHERANRLLRFISDQSRTVGREYDTVEDAPGAYAWSESVGREEIDFFIHYLLEAGSLATMPNVRRIQRGYYSIPRMVFLTVEGHSQIEQQECNVDSAQAFVAMWFNKSMADAYREGIEPAIRDAGYNPLRIDQKEHINKIDDEIIAEIRRSRFVVADFTHGKDGARGGVYYEAGFAHGLNLPVIFTCMADSGSTLHFDTNHFNHIFWTTPEELREKLKNRILRVIGEGPEAR